jgi:hypothetical protein
VREPWHCAAADAPGLVRETLVTGGHRWQLAGRVMALDGPGADELSIGVIADAAGSAPATLAALGRLRARLDQVDLVISLGGMAATRGELEAIFAALADRAAWPLVALPGDLEPVLAQADAIAAARQRGLAVIDGRLVQRIELPAATIALIPGAGAGARLAAGGDGCSYRSEDVAAVFTELTRRAGLRIAASSEPPRNTATGDSPTEPTGELALAPGAGHEIDIALYAATSTAATATRSGYRDGAAVPLTPGSSDASPRLPARHRPSAGILTVHGSAWTWSPIEDGSGSGTH